MSPIGPKAPAAVPGQPIREPPGSEMRSQPEPSNWSAATAARVGASLAVSGWREHREPPVRRTAKLGMDAVPHHKRPTAVCHSCAVHVASLPQ